MLFVLQKQVTYSVWNNDYYDIVQTFVKKEIKVSINIPERCLNRSKANNRIPSIPRIGGMYHRYEFFSVKSRKKMKEERRREII